MNSPIHNIPGLSSPSSSYKLLRVDRYWVTTSKQTKKHPLLGNGREISNILEPLQGNAFANKHIPMETLAVQQRTVFSTRSVPRCTDISCKSVVTECVGRSVQLKNLHYEGPLPGND
jgi:hypothetical protein